MLKDSRNVGWGGWLSFPPKNGTLWCQGNYLLTWRSELSILKDTMNWSIKYIPSYHTLPNWKFIPSLSKQLYLTSSMLTSGLCSEDDTQFFSSMGLKCTKSEQSFLNIEKTLQTRNPLSWLVKGNTTYAAQEACAKSPLSNCVQICEDERLSWKGELERNEAGEKHKGY